MLRMQPEAGCWKGCLAFRTNYQMLSTSTNTLSRFGGPRCLRSIHNPQWRRIFSITSFCSRSMKEIIRIFSPQSGRLSAVLASAAFTTSCCLPLQWIYFKDALDKHGPGRGIFSHYFLFLRLLAGLPLCPLASHLVGIRTARSCECRRSNDDGKAAIRNNAAGVRPYSGCAG